MRPSSGRRLCGSEPLPADDTSCLVLCGLLLGMLTLTVSDVFSERYDDGDPERSAAARAARPRRLAFRRQTVKQAQRPQQQPAGSVAARMTAHRARPALG